MGTGKVELYVIFFFFTILICNDGSRLLLFMLKQDNTNWCIQMFTEEFDA